MSSVKVNTWSTKCQSSNGLKVTLFKKRKSPPEEPNDVGGGSAEELKQNHTVGLGGPRWTIESNKNPCKLVIKRRKTNDYPDSSKGICSSGEPSLKMRLVASTTKTNQDSETTFLRVKNWCKQQNSNSASVALCDSYLATDLQSSQSSPKCSGLEGCLAAELFHLQPSPKDSGIDVSSPPRRLDEIHLTDVSGCVAMATISESATTTFSNVTSMVVSDVVMAMFSNVESGNQDGMLHAAKHGVGKNALKTGEAGACGEVVNQPGGRTTRRLSNLQSLCSYASPKAPSAAEDDRIMLRLPSSMFRSTVAGNTRTKNSSASSTATGVRSRRQIRSDSSNTGALDIVKKTGNDPETGQILTSVTESKDPGVPKITAVTGNNHPIGPIFVRKGKNKTKTSQVVDKEINSQDTDITGQVKSMDQTDPVVMVTKSSRVRKEKRSKLQTGPKEKRSNRIMAKIYPNISIENRSEDQTDPSITEKDRRKDQTDPSITEKDESKAQIDANIIETDRSEDQTDPSITEKATRKDQTDPSITGKARRKDQTDPSIAEKATRKDQTDPSIAEKATRKDQKDPSITEKATRKDQTDPSITEKARRKDQTDPSIAEKDESKAQTDTSIIETDRSENQTDPSITEKATRKDQTDPSITEKATRKDQTDPSITEKATRKDQTDPSITEKATRKDQTDSSITEKDRIMEQTTRSIASKSRSKEQIGPSTTGRERTKAPVGTSITGKLRRQKHVGPNGIASMSIKDPAEQSHAEEKRSKILTAISIKDPAEQSHAEEKRSTNQTAISMKVLNQQSHAVEKRSKNQTSSAVSGDMKTKSRYCPVSKETNSKDSAVSDETKSKNQVSQRIVTPMMMNKNDQACAGISGEARSKSQTGPKADKEIRNKNQSVPVVIEGTRSRNANGSAIKREMKSRNQICPSAMKEMNIKDMAGAADTKKMKSQNQIEPVDTPQTYLKAHAASSCSSTRNNSEFNLVCALELNTMNQTTGGIASKASTAEIQGSDEAAKSLKRKSSTEACELIPERQPKRNNSALQARKWHAGSRNSASRRSYGRLCHATELPPPLLTAACSDPLRTMENSVESRQTNSLLSRPNLLRERRRSGSTAACATDERAKTVAKPLSLDNGITERDHQLSSLYDFEDDSPPVLDLINTSVNGRSIFPHRSRLPWKERSVGSSGCPSVPLNTSTDQDASKSVNLMPKLVQSSLVNSVDLPIVEATGSRSKSNVRQKPLTKSTGSYIGEFASYVSSPQPNSNEAEEHAPTLSASNVVQEAKTDKVERLNVNVKRDKGLPVGGALKVANENRSKYSVTRKKPEKPGGRNTVSKCKNLSKPTTCELQTTSPLSFAPEVQDICQAVTQDDKSGLCTSKEKHLEIEGPISDDASAMDCSLCTDTLRTVTYHKPISENTSETSETSVEPEERDFSSFVSGHKSLACLQDKVARLLRTVFPGIVDLYDKLNIPVVCKLLDQLLDEMACDKTEGKTLSRIETCCCNCEVRLCRTPTECLRVFQRKVLGLLRILLPSTDLENVDAVDIELLVDAVTLANATELGEELCPSEPCCLGSSHIHKTVNANSEEHCCSNACCCCRQDGQRDLCCHGGERSHDNLNFGGDVQYFANLASTCSEGLLLKSEARCINR